MHITFDNVWEFIHKASKIQFPGNVKLEWRFLGEYISENEPYIQYRLYKDEIGNERYAKIDIRTGINV